MEENFTLEEQQKNIIQAQRNRSGLKRDLDFITGLTLGS